MKISLVREGADEDQCTMKVRLIFDGTVDVFLPKAVPEDLRQILAMRLAMAGVQAYMQSDTEPEACGCLAMARKEFTKDAADYEIPAPLAEAMFDESYYGGGPDGEWSSESEVREEVNDASNDG